MELGHPFTEAEFNQIAEALVKYVQLGKAEQAALKPSIDKQYEAVYDNYAARVCADKQLFEMIKFNQDFEEVVGFDIKKHFKKPVLTKNTNPFTTPDIEFEYDEQAYNRCKDAYEHKDQYRMDINSKKTKIDQQRFVFGRKFKLARLEIELGDLELNANQYGDLKPRIDKRQSYISTRMETYWHNKECIKEKCKKYAYDAVYNFVKKNPAILCTEHNNNYIRSYEDKVDCEPVNNITNQLRNLFPLEILVKNNHINQMDVEKE